MVLRMGSIRTKLLILVGGVALLVGGVSAIVSSWSSGGLLEQQLRRRGYYIASNLAKNSNCLLYTSPSPRD